MFSYFLKDVVPELQRCVPIEYRALARYVDCLLEIICRGPYIYNVNNLNKKMIFFKVGYSSCQKYNI